MSDMRDEHDRGLAHDLNVLEQRMRQRRRLLGLLGAAALAGGAAAQARRPGGFRPTGGTTGTTTNTTARIAAITPTLSGSVANGFTGAVTVGVAR